MVAQGQASAQAYFDSRDFYKAAFRLLLEANPTTPVLNIAVSCFRIESKKNSLQLNFFEDVGKKQNLVWR